MLAEGAPTPSMSQSKKRRADGPADGEAKRGDDAAEVEVPKVERGTHEEEAENSEHGRPGRIVRAFLDAQLLGHGDRGTL